MHHLRLYVHHRTIYNNSYKQSIEAGLVQRNWHSVNDATRSRARLRETKDCLSVDSKQIRERR